MRYGTIREVLYEPKEQYFNLVQSQTLYCGLKEKNGTVDDNLELFMRVRSDYGLGLSFKAFDRIDATNHIMQSRFK